MISTCPRLRICIMLEKPEESIKNGQSKDIGNIGHKLQVLEMGEHLLFLVRLPPVYPYNQVR